MDLINDLQNKKYKLLLLIGKPGSGKSKFFHNYSMEKGIPILNLDTILGKKIPDGKNSNYIYDFVRGFLKTYQQKEILLDKKTILYQDDTNIDLLDFLKELSTNKVVIATWNGYTKDNKLYHVCTALNKTIEYNLNDIDCSYIELK